MNPFPLGNRYGYKFTLVEENPGEFRVFCDGQPYVGRYRQVGNIAIDLPGGPFFRIGEDLHLYSKRIPPGTIFSSLKKCNGIVLCATLTEENKSCTSGLKEPSPVEKICKV